MSIFKIIPVVGWLLEGGEAVDPRLLQLLEGIESEGSLQQSARRHGLSYRHAWGLLEHWGQRFGQPLALLERGRGASLSHVGAALLEAQRQASAVTREALQSIAAQFQRSIDASSTDDSDPDAAHLRGASLRSASLQVCASHDLALARARDALAAGGVDLALQVQGSLDALQSLLARHCDIAGFHLRHGQSVQAWLLQHGAGNAPMRRQGSTAGSSKRPSNLLLAVLTEREQGLMLTQGLAAHIKSLSDLARGGQRFLNRQRGSGTRALLDELLREAGLRPAMIRGYQDEEFTHLAVAASIAGGGAEAGFGIRAAAERFGLAFVPLAKETYYLATRADGAIAPSFSRIAAWLRGAAFRTLCHDLAGYDTTHAGEESLFEPPRRPRGRPRGSGTG